MHSNQKTSSASATLFALAVHLVASPCLQAQTARTRPTHTQSPPAAQPPLIGTLNSGLASALGPGSTNKLGSASAVSSANGSPSVLRLGGSVLVPLRVIDAPAYTRGGSTRAMQPVSPTVVSEPSFYPTMQPPKWRLVAEEHPVQAWRVIEVEDVVCSTAGVCSSVLTRMIARWAPMLGAYAFVDRVGRIWRVE